MEAVTSLDELMRELADAGLDHAAEKLAQLTRPCYRVSRALVAEEQIPIGASRFGGSPDVPTEFDWPQTSKDKNPVTMEFVGQIRLRDLPKPAPESVPDDGLLSFFTNWSEGRVFHFPEGTPLQRSEGPKAAVEPAPSGLLQNFRAAFRRKPQPRRTYRAATLTFEPALSPPEGGSSMVDQLKLSEAERETYFELLETWWAKSPEGEVLKHQMFGHASPIQGEMELECHFLRRGEEWRGNSPPEEWASAARDWILLLQVDSDDGKTGPGWMWGDGGMVYFWIHREDLAARAFDRVIAIEQCY